MLYVLYVMGFSLAKVLPIGACYVIADLGARLYYIFAGKDRAALKANLKVVLGDEVDDATLNRHVWEVFRNFAKYLADFFKFPRLDKDYITRLVKCDKLNFLDECISEGKGAVIVSAHLGNWELGGAVVSALKYPLQAIVLEHNNEQITEFFERQRAINEMSTIKIGTHPSMEQMKKCLNVLKQNELLVVVGDKDYTNNGLYVDFFEKKALMPKGPAIFSLRTGAPIIVIVLTREKNDKFTLHIERPIKYKPTGEFEKDVRTLMGKYIEQMEKYIRDYPGQWYAFRKIWNHEQITL